MGVDAPMPGTIMGRSVRRCSSAGPVFPAHRGIATVTLLEVRHVGKSFRGLRAVHDASFEIPEGRINGLIGPNGAGKTTIFNMIAGVFAPDTGEIIFQGKPIHGLRPDQVCAAGIGRTFQIVKPFAGLTVLENVMVGGFLRERTAGGARAVALNVIKKMNLEAKASQPASSLTLPDRKRLEVARALATRPRLLLLDEVMAGLRPTECDQMVEIFRDLNRTDGTTILLIEHVMRAVMALANHIGVLHHGEVIARGTPQEVVKDRAVLDCYLGEETEV
jgi:branched-chain amino acid transport system ATP-binding protein